MQPNEKARHLQDQREFVEKCSRISDASGICCRKTSRTNVSEYEFSINEIQDRVSREFEISSIIKYRQS